MVSRAWRVVWPALLIAGAGLAGTGDAGEGEFGWTRSPDLTAYLLVVAAAAAALALRRLPAVTLAGCGAAVVAYLAAGYPVGPILVAVPVAAAGVAVAWPAGRSVPANVALGLAVYVAGGLRFGLPYSGVAGTWPLLVLLAVALPAAIGVNVRTRRDALADVHEANVLRVVADERTRMAHELHDAVGHGLAVIAMQAGVALHVLDRDPGKARESLEAIRATSRDALDGMRAELGLLRGEGDGPRRPAAGLAEAPVLLQRIRSGGLAVAADIWAGELPQEVDVAAYRILQEALTNVLRHADAGNARVRVARDGDDLLVEVHDDGRAAGAATGGSGITGMRTRAARAGGTLEAGPRPGGGFAVTARLPLEPPVERAP
ncbi:sensor histidine kinase [Dactylosporangium sp. NBC_01737]|uniref:sensor histidine kinase n=1 Tax=Dactylosporangium sp. NBC_01737 TaxID=2975959 RepID=UPI002E11DB11|nr:sensor histidine kinase [Dactylosporangium sp. NBC_01737]